MICALYFVYDKQPMQNMGNSACQTHTRPCFKAQPWKSLNSKVGFVGTREKLQIHMKRLRSFSNCKFAEKRLFIHSTYKCDEKSTPSDYPFTHVSRKTPTLPKIAFTAPAKSSSAAGLCRCFLALMQASVLTPSYLRPLRGTSSFRQLESFYLPLLPDCRAGQTFGTWNILIS